MPRVHLFQSDFQRGGLRVTALVVFLAAAVACGRAPGPITLTLTPPSGADPALVRVSGLSSAEITSLRSASLGPASWSEILNINVVGNESLPVAGDYSVVADAVLFRPRFPLDPGRKYVVRFDSRRLPTPRSDGLIAAVVSLPAPAAGVATRVTGISPTGVWPENTLRFYVYFSGPMSRSSALDFVQLQDESGKEVKEAFLPLDVEMWNADHTRVTVFFDPGRVKRGIRPNVELGRALDAGRRYAIAVSGAWRDASGQPLAAAYRHEFSIGPAEERAVTPADWRIDSPAANSRTPVVVTFPWTLDRALVQRTIGVATSDGTPLEGETTVDDDDKHWRFTPRQPWRAGAHALVVLTILEDPAGNRVGRPFEIEMFRGAKEEPKERVTVPFQIR